MANQQGEFIWYELLTEDWQGALKFYGAILGWQSRDSGQSGMEYKIISAEDSDNGESHDVCGLMQITAEMRDSGARPVWLGYLGVEDVDQSIANLAAAGGQIQMPPMDIPDVGRIAMLTDPQGAPFYVMRGSSDQTSMAFAADKPRVGHCAWNELVTADPEAAKAFYFDEFNWSKDSEMDMGPMGVYEFLRHNGLGELGLIGAMMPKPEQMPVSMWGFYFRCADIDEAFTAITANGGQIVHGPAEIPGDEFIIQGHCCPINFHSSTI